MKINTTAVIILSVLAALLVFTACDDFGIYATIAVTDKIDEGLLPEGISPSKVIHCETPLNATDTIGDYDFFSSGPRIWARNISDRSTVTDSTKWFSIGLNGWDAVQSMAASDDRIAVILSRGSSSSHELGLFYFDSYSGGDISFTQVTGTGWAASSSNWYQAELFCPDPYDISNDVFFVSVRNQSGEFGNETSNFNGSELYTYDFTTGGDDWTNATLLNDGTSNDWDTNISDTSYYVSDMAYDGGANALAMAVDASRSSGTLISFDLGNPYGGAITTPSYGDTMATRGLTWLPAINAFIMGGASISGSYYPIYVSYAGVDNWTTTEGSTSYPLQSFLDVSGTTAGADLILAGTISWSDDSADGYLEIDISDDPADATTWDVVSDYFADSTNYLSTSIDDVSVVLSMPEHQGTPTDTNQWRTFWGLKQYVYASTSREGLWRIDADEGSTPDWYQE